MSAHPARTVHPASTALDLLVVGLALRQVTSGRLVALWNAAGLSVGAPWSTWALLATGTIAAARLLRRWLRRAPDEAGAADR